MNIRTFADLANNQAVIRGNDLIVLDQDGVDVVGFQVVELTKEEAAHLGKDPALRYIMIVSSCA